MNHKVYYNDIDPKVCAWVTELIKDGAIEPGDVDCRSITEIKADEIKHYTRIHLFCGVAGWDKALNLAQWPRDRPVITASCPCPPFSNAGKKKACPRCHGSHPVCCPRRTGYFICCDCGHAWLADSRHLWPEVWRLLCDIRTHVVIGEQVSSPDGRVWLAGVRASLEILGFTVGAADICSPCVGSPNIRQRLYWLADSQYAKRWTEHEEHSETQGRNGSGGSGAVDRLVLTDGARRQQGQPATSSTGQRCSTKPAGSDDHRLGHTSRDNQRREWQSGAGNGWDGTVGRPGPWSDYDFVECQGGKLRRIESRFRSISDAGEHCLRDMDEGWRQSNGAIFPLAQKVEHRSHLLRGAGNMISPPLAAEFVKAFLAIENE